MEQNNKLVVLGQDDIKKGGLGFSNSSLFKLKPATLQLVQKMSRAEGAQPGKIRVRETGQHFTEMEVVLLFEPVERRAMFEGDDFSGGPICFSLDMREPHPKAKEAQSMYCGSCTKANWDKYEQTKNKKDIPPCKPFFRALAIDKETKLPYNIDFRGMSRGPFKEAMQNIARVYALLQSQGKNPNIFDISFTLYVVPKEKGTYFVYGFKDFKPIPDGEKEQFGSIFLDFANRNTNAAADEEEYVKAAEVESKNEAASESIVDGEYITI